MPSRSRLACASRRIESRFRLCTTRRPGPSSSEALVNTYGRSSRPSSARPTTRSEWPKPYAAAVSIQLTPSSSARSIASIDSSSSCRPQPNSQPPPPIAQAPKPTRVISRPVFPSCVVLSCVFCITSPFSRSAITPQPLAYRARTLLLVRDECEDDGRERGDRGGEDQPGRAQPLELGEEPDADDRQRDRDVGDNEEARGDLASARRRRCLVDRRETGAEAQPLAQSGNDPAGDHKRERRDAESEGQNPHPCQQPGAPGDECRRTERTRRQRLADRRRGEDREDDEADDRAVVDAEDLAQ